MTRSLSSRLRIGSGGSERALTLLLSAALCAPLLARMLGWRLAVPSGGIGLASGACVAVAALVVGVWRLRTRGRSAVQSALVFTAELLVLTGTFALVAERRANAFFTATILADVMALVLAQHLVGMGLRHLTVATSEPRGAQRGGAARAFATHVADDFVTVQAILVAGFWLFAALAYHLAAGTLLLLGAAAGPLVLLARLFAALTDAGAFRLRPPSRRLS
jgi:hypothetical protein